MKTPKASVRMIDRQTASDLITRHEDNFNRSISDKQVKRYEKILKSGKWKLTPDAILLDSAGRVLNGQHRLWAINNLPVTNTASFPLLFLTGADAEAQFATDIGRPRLARDLFKARGKSGDGHNAAIAKKIALTEKTFDSLTDQVNYAITIEHSVNFAIENIKRHMQDANIRGLVCSGFGAALGRAHLCKINPALLIEFAGCVLLPEYPGRNEDPGIDFCRRFRTHIVKNWNTPGKRINQEHIYWTSQTALHNWLNKRYDEPVGNTIGRQLFKR